MYKNYNHDIENQEGITVVIKQFHSTHWYSDTMNQTCTLLKQFSCFWYVVSQHYWRQLVRKEVKTDTHTATNHHHHYTTTAKTLGKIRQKINMNWVTCIHSVAVWSSSSKKKSHQHWMQITLTTAALILTWNCTYVMDGYRDNGQTTTSTTTLSHMDRDTDTVGQRSITLVLVLIIATAIIIIIIFK